MVENKCIPNNLLKCPLSNETTFALKHTMDNLWLPWLKTADEATTKSSNDDVIFIVENHRFAINRAALSDHSPVFKAMLFGNGFSESLQLEINLPGKCSQSFAIFLNCIFNFSSFETWAMDSKVDKMEIEELIIALLLLANEYQTNNLELQLTNFIHDQVCLYHFCHSL